MIALQTISSYGIAARMNVDTFHRAQDERVTMSTVDIRRHVMAGVATSLMGDLTQLQLGQYHLQLKLKNSLPLIA